MNRTLTLGLAIATWCPVGALCAASNTDAAPFDLVVTNARIVDGAGNAWYRGDVGVRDGRIAAIGQLRDRAATRVVDGGDRVLAPGFIDMMGQSSLVLAQDPASAQSHLRQGITTLLAGEGVSHAPQNERTQPAPQSIAGREEQVRWRSFAEYFGLLESAGLGMNVVHNVGAAQVRRVVIGDEDRRPTAEETAAMKRLVAEAMRDGAVGLSTALIYQPGSFATTEELIELARVAGAGGGFYMTHLRSEGDGLLESIDEALRIGREADLPVHIFHLKAGGKANWPKMALAIARINAARAAGQDVTSDIYPYVRSGTGLDACIPPWRFAAGAEAMRASLRDPEVRRAIRREIEERGDWENIYRSLGNSWEPVLLGHVGQFADQAIVGLSLAAAAQQRKQDVWDLFFDLVQTGGVRMAPESMNERQKRDGLLQPWMMIDTDSAPMNPERVATAHPRAFGAFPRILARYVREDGLLTLEEAVRRMTSLAANRLGLRDRGRIVVGLAADLVIFDPDRVQDRATFTDPLRYADGMDYVFVNGVAVIDDGRFIDARPGRVLRHASRSEQVSARGGR